MSGSLIANKGCHRIDIQFDQSAHASTKPAKHNTANWTRQFFQLIGKDIVEDTLDVDGCRIVDRGAIVTVIKLGSKSGSTTSKALAKRAFAI